VQQNFEEDEKGDMFKIEILKCILILMFVRDVETVLKNQIA
jgi:hypothetical protein